MNPPEHHNAARGADESHVPWLARPCPFNNFMALLLAVAVLALLLADYLNLTERDVRSIVRDDASVLIQEYSKTNSPPK